MPPVADWVCLSRKCLQDGANTVYQDLPLATRFCPACGSKRIRRIYTAPAVLKGSREVQRVIDQAGSEAQASQTRLRDAEITAKKMQVPMFAVPIKSLGAKLAAIGMPAQQAEAVQQSTNARFGSGRLTPQPAMPLMHDLRRNPPRPGPDSRSDRAKIQGGKVVEG